jgi:hypothetical protein
MNYNLLLYYNMKIFITFDLIKMNKMDKFGGGLFFFKSFLDKFIDHQFTNKLDDTVDLIVICGLSKSKINLFDISDIIKFKEKYNKKTIIRINECDIKREKQIGVEKKVLESFKICDRVIFVSEWLKTYYLEKYNIIDSNKFRFVFNGVNTSIYKYIPKHINTKIRIVTHHWSDNWFKGFDFYDILDKKSVSNNFEFVFIGNVNKNIKFKNTEYHNPCDSNQIAKILNTCHIYVTATKFEPSGNHFMEGLACGLPCLFRQDGGGVTEVAKLFGELYENFDDFMVGLDKIKRNYKLYQDKIVSNYGVLEMDESLKLYN